ncbi:MAG: TIGR03067 domain-containing protein [Planctomycetaceae bacterium]
MRTIGIAVVCCGLLSGIGADAPTEKAAASRLKQFQGTWAIDSVEVDGVVDREAMSQIRYVFHDRSYAMQLAGRTVEKGTVTLDVDGRDWTIDLRKSGEKEPVSGIFEFSDGVLRICFAPPREDRPQAFKGGDGNSLLVLKRAKTE